MPLTMPAARTFGEEVTFSCNAMIGNLLIQPAIVPSEANASRLEYRHHARGPVPLPWKVRCGSCRVFEAMPDLPWDIAHCGGGTCRDMARRYAFCVWPAAARSRAAISSTPSA